MFITQMNDHLICVNVFSSSSEVFAEVALLTTHLRMIHVPIDIVHEERVAAGTEKLADC